MSFFSLRLALVLFISLCFSACQSPGVKSRTSYRLPGGDVFRIQKLDDGAGGFQNSLWRLDSEGEPSEMVVDWGTYTEIKVTTDGHYFVEVGDADWWSIAGGLPDQKMDDWKSLLARRDSKTQKTQWHVRHRSRAELSLVDAKGSTLLTVPAAEVKYPGHLVTTSVDGAVWQVRDLKLNVQIADAERFTRGRYLGRTPKGWLLWDLKEGFSDLDSPHLIERLPGASSAGWFIRQTEGEPGQIWDRQLTEVIFDSVDSIEWVEVEDSRLPEGRASFLHAVIDDGHFEVLALAPFVHRYVYFRGLRTIEGPADAQAMVVAELNRRDAGAPARERFRKEHDQLRLGDYLTPLESGELDRDLVQRDTPQFSAEGPGGVSIYRMYIARENPTYSFLAGPFAEAAAVKCETDEGLRLVAWRIRDLPGNPTRLVDCSLENTLSNDADKYPEVKAMQGSTFTTIQFGGADGVFLMGRRGTVGVNGQYEAFEAVQNAFDTGFGFWLCHRKDGQLELLHAIGELPQLTAPSLEYTKVTSSSGRVTQRIVVFESEDGRFGAKVGLADLGQQPPLLVADTKAELLAGLPAAYDLYLVEIARRNAEYDAAIAKRKAEEEARRIADSWCRECAGIGLEVINSQTYYEGFGGGMVTRYLVTGQYRGSGWRRTPVTFFPDPCSVCLGKGRRENPPEWVPVTVHSDGLIILHN